MSDDRAYAMCLACGWESLRVTESEADELGEEHDRTVHQGQKTAVIAKDD